MSKVVKNSKRSKKYKYLYYFIFIIGFVVLSYPILSQQYYRLNSNSIIKDFDKEVKKLEDADISKKIGLAKAYNRALTPFKISDPYKKYTEEEGVAEYARMLEINELIGHVEIPKIKQDLPIYAGTSEKVLQKGAGHMEGTSLPVGGKSTHTVITAHRGLPSATMFRELDELKIGDVFFVHNLGGSLAYKVDKIVTVTPSDFEPVMVKKGKDYATLLTCTPYMVNSHRLLVRGYRIPYNFEDKVKEEKKRGFKINWLYIWIGSVVFIALSMLYYAKKDDKKAKNKKISNKNKQ